MTGQQLIESALRMVTGGRDYQPEHIEDGLTALNILKNAWAEENFLQHDSVSESFAVVADTFSYTLGPTGVFVTARPTTINSAFLRKDDTDYPLEIITDGEYNEIDQKESVSAYPIQLFVSYAHPDITLKLWPVPDVDFTLYLDSFKPLADFALDAEISLPPAYERAFKFNLAVELYPEFPMVPPSPALVAMAAESKEVIKRSNTRLVPKAVFEFGQPARPYNIYRG